MVFKILKHDITDFRTFVSDDDRAEKNSEKLFRKLHAKGGC